MNDLPSHDKGSAMPTQPLALGPSPPPPATARLRYPPALHHSAAPLPGRWTQARQAIASRAAGLASLVPNFWPVHFFRSRVS